MDIEIARSALTVLSVLTFAGVAAWAYAPTHRARFERDALLPFSHGEPAADADRSGGPTLASTGEQDPR